MLRAEKEARMKAEQEARQREREEKERFRKEAERAQQKAAEERQEKQRLAEERSRKVEQRAYEAQKKAADERLRIMKEAEERVRLLEIAQRQRGAEERSAKVAEQARIQQEKRAKERLAEMKANEERVWLKAHNQELWEVVRDARMAKLTERKRSCEAEQRRIGIFIRQLEDSNDRREVRRYLRPDYIDSVFFNDSLRDQDPYHLPTSSILQDFSTIPSYHLPDKERRVRKGLLWVRELHAVHAITKGMFAAPQFACIDLEWPKKSGAAICDFCDGIMMLYSFRCPLGGAAACGDCKYKFAHGCETANGEKKDCRTCKANAKGKGEE